MTEKRRVQEDFAVKKQYDGIVNVFKVPGYTSHDVVARIRRIYGNKKVGHAGTLDPEATGVLPVFIGAATRLLEYAVDGRKCYRAEALLGVTTDTGDDSGKILTSKEVKKLNADDIEKVLERFRGPIMQVPPMYSALKVKGKKLYEYARKGIEVERKARPIEIYKLELVDINLPYLTLEIECSKGTYIRTLLEDIGKELECGACMNFLLRRRVASFTEDKAFFLEEIADNRDDCIFPVADAVAHLPELTVNPLQAYRITNGVKTTIMGTEDGSYALYEKDFLGVVSVSDSVVKPVKIIYHSDFRPEKKN